MKNAPDSGAFFVRPGLVSDKPAPAEPVARADQPQAQQEQPDFARLRHAERIRGECYVVELERIVRTGHHDPIECRRQVDVDIAGAYGGLVAIYAVPGPGYSRYGTAPERIDQRAAQVERDGVVGVHRTPQQAQIPRAGGKDQLRI